MQKPKYYIGQIIVTESIGDYEQHLVKGAKFYSGGWYYYALDVNLDYSPETVHQISENDVVAHLNSAGAWKGSAIDESGRIAI